MSDELLYEVKGHAAWITLNRPEKRNAISVAMIERFNEYLDAIEADESIRVVCLTGAGDTTFCSGADLAGAFEGGPQQGALKYANLLLRLNRFCKPLVARLNGHCLAGGMGLMLSCDIAYAKEGIYIGTPEVKVGLFPMMIGALIFKNAIRKQALEMIYTARMLSPLQAERMGLITRTYEAEDLDREVEETLADIAKNAPLAIQAGRQALAAAEEMDLENAFPFLADELGKIFQSEDAAEGLSAFFQKREPVWKNR